MPVRRVYRRRRYRKGGRIATKRFVYRAIHKNIENKMVTSSLTQLFNSISNAWIERDICTLAAGTSEGTRVGDRVTVKSIEIKGVIAQGSNETALDDPYNNVRMVIGLYDTAGATPLATNPSGAITINTPFRPGWVCDTLRKKYLDKYIPLQITSTEKGGGDGYTPGVRTIRYYKRFKRGLQISWSDSTANYPKSRLMLAFISDSSAIPNPGIISGYCVVTYEDA